MTAYRLESNENLIKIMALLKPWGHSHAFWRCHACRAVEIPIFSAAVAQHAQWPHIFIENRRISLNDPLFFSPKANYFSISTVIWNSNDLCAKPSWNSSHQRPKITFSPNAPIIFDQNAVCHQWPYIFFLTWCVWVRKPVPYTYIDFIYECPSPPPVLIKFDCLEHKGAKCMLPASDLYTISAILSLAPDCLWAVATGNRMCI